MNKDPFGVATDVRGELCPSHGGIYRREKTVLAAVNRGQALLPRFERGIMFLVPVVEGKNVQVPVVIYKREQQW